MKRHLFNKGDGFIASTQALIDENGLITVTFFHSDHEPPGRGVTSQIRLAREASDLFLEARDAEQRPTRPSLESMAKALALMVEVS